MKKLIIALFLLCLMGTAVAEGIEIETNCFAMYSTACEVVGDFAKVNYTPSNEAGTLKMGNVVINAQDCAVEYIEGENDIFTIPVNVMMFANILASELNNIDPENNDIYQERMKGIIEEYGDMDLEIREVVDKDTKISCSDGSMAYFAEEYGVQISENEGIELRTFNTPSEEESATAYCVLMRENIEALKK